MGDTELKISQLADDTTCLLADIASTKELMNIFTRFHLLSGLKCNLDKTEALWIGSRAGAEDGDLPVRWATNEFSTLGIKFSTTGVPLHVLNFPDKLSKLRSTLNLWKSRDLSLIGKNVILKSLGVSQLLYVTSVMFIPEDYIKTVQDEINNFLWKGARPKVKSAVMYKSIDEGGLKLLHFNTQVRAIQLNWVKRFLNNDKAKWKDMVQSFTPKINLYLILESRSTVNLSNSNLPVFYQDIIRWWRNLRQSSLPRNKNDVLHEYIWYNPNITQGSSTIFFQMWHENGINNLMDIMSPDGQFHSPDEIENKFSFNPPFLEYYTIRASIPYEWKLLLRTGPDVPIENECDPYVYFKNAKRSVSTLSCKEIYTLFIQHLTCNETPTSIVKWDTDLFTDVNTPWADIFSLSFRSTLESKLQAFQFSVLHRFVPYKKKLFLMNLVDSELCNYCNVTESILHRFYECSTTTIFWENFEHWWNNLNITEIAMSCNLVMLGAYYANCYALNNCLLQAKFFIHKCKLGNTPICFANFCKFLKMKVEIEKHILFVKRKWSLFESRWEKILDSIQ